MSALKNPSEVVELSADRGTTMDQVRVRVLPDGRMTRADAARYLGRATKTLAMWALYGAGPRSIKVAGRVFYFRADLDNFIAGRTAAETANTQT
jgi:hypothetical protein